MRLMRIGEPAEQRRVLLTADGLHLDLSSLTDDIDGAFLVEGGLERVRKAAGSGRRIGAPGGLLNTGTPEGLALSGRLPYLAPGDVVSLSIDGLGTQMQRLRPA